MFHTIAPLLVSYGFAVIVPDLPGMGQSLHRDARKAPLNSVNAAAGLIAVVRAFGISRGLSIFAFDKGCAPAVLLARDHPDLVLGLAVSEFALPGYGLELVQQPSADKTLFDHWHLGLFTLPAAASFLIRGREEQFLTWYFWHSSYSGLNAMKPDHFRRYVQEWMRPGGLEAGLEFLGGSTWEDAKEFQGVSVTTRILAMGGEAAMGNEQLLNMVWGHVSQNKSLQTAIVQKAGHWLGDENPREVADILHRWIDQAPENVPEVDLQGDEVFHGK
jgi:pimeloyl-ACP methyl ester carboxylesterase